MKNKSLCFIKLMSFFLAFYVAKANSLKQNSENLSSSQYKLFYQDNIINSDSGKLYSINFSENSAELTLLTNLSYRAHISYDSVNDLIYTFKNNGKLLEAFSTNGNLVSSINIEENIGSVTCNTYYNGSIYLGDAEFNQILEIDPKTGLIKSIVAKNVPVKGGDLVFKNDELYLFSRGTKNTLVYKITNGEAVLHSNAISNNKVTGATLNADNNFVVAISNTNKFLKLNEYGVKIGYYDILSNGQSFSLASAGDLAGGHFINYKDPGNGNCSQFNFYLSDNTNDGKGPGRLFGVDFKNGNAELTEIVQFNYNAHIALDTTNNEIFVVNREGTEFLKVDPLTGGILKNTTISPSLGITTTAVFYNNEFYVGSHAQNKIVKLNEDGSYNEVVTNIPVQGGDLIVIDNQLYLGSRNGDALYVVNVNNNNYTKVNNLATKVSGLALTATNTILMSNTDATSFTELSQDGKVIGNYPVYFNGEVFTFSGGDLTSGCITNFEAEENQCSTKLVNGGFEINNSISGSWDYVPQDQVPGWSTASKKETIEIQKNGGTGDIINSNSGNYHFELNGDGLNNLYQGFCTIPGTNVQVNFSHKKRRPTGEDKLELYIGNDIETIETNTPISYQASSVDNWEQNSYIFTVPENQNYTYIYFKAISGTSKTVGNLLDDISVTTTLLPISKIEPIGEYTIETVLNNNELSTTNVKGNEEIILYPTLVTNLLTIKLPNNSTINSFEILSLTGQSYAKGSIVDNENKVVTNVDDLDNGIYLLVLKSTTNNKVEIQKFVKTNN